MMILHFKRQIRCVGGCGKINIMPLQTSKYRGQLNEEVESYRLRNLKLIFFVYSLN